MPDQPMLEVSDLAVSFDTTGQDAPGRFSVLDGLSLDIAPGEFVSVLGPSGCGKTTLLRVIVGLIEAERGSIKIAGQERYKLGEDVCLVFQSYGLFPWRTVRENIEFGLKLRNVPAAQRREVSNHYIQLTGLSGFENHYPHQISGGMQQRVGVARGLSCRPKLLLMDEPFAAVDAHTRERLQTELLRIVGNREERGSTVVFVTHSIEEAIYLGTRVLVMSSAPGQIIKDMRVDLGDERWKDDVRLGSDFEAYVREARLALREGFAGERA
jgi:NitT/TauT family transport system ATP-binding protein